MAKKEVRQSKLSISILVLVFIAVLIFLALRKETAPQPAQVSVYNALQKASEHYDKGLYPDALLQYKKALELNNKTYEAYLGIGHSYLQLNLYNEALKAFQKTFGLDYHDFRTYYGLGLAYYFKEDYNSAYLNFVRAYELNPNNKAVASYLLNAYNAVGLYDEAINLANIKLATDQTNSQYYRKKAIADLLKNDLQKAAENAKKAVEIRSDYPGNHLTLGIVYMGLGEKENALEQFKKSLVQPQHTGFEGSAITYQLLNDDLNYQKNAKSASKYPRHSNSLSLLGFALLNLKEYGKAINEFNSAIENTPSYYLPYKGLGKAYMELGNKENAVANFEKAAQLNYLDEESKKLLEEARRLG
ncbi:tetratricopeptide repeat protein [Candidatus Woesearchaeota archaeon]|nr:tetratricopeptide repeat protein [Candidatus Woesearchaeota archaeon]